MQHYDCTQIASSRYVTSPPSLLDAEHGLTLLPRMRIDELYDEAAQKGTAPQKQFRRGNMHNGPFSTLFATKYARFLLKKNGANRPK